MLNISFYITFLRSLLNISINGKSPMDLLLLGSYLHKIIMYSNKVKLVAGQNNEPPQLLAIRTYH